MKALAALALTALALAGCQREERSFRSSPTESEEKVALVPLFPGSSGPTSEISGKGKEFEGNAYHLAQGKTLYRWFNCVGCHANGGGGSGPALIDDVWIYGGSIENIVHTIREGRPNGMPSFRGKIPDDQIWQIAGYVRSMSGNVPKDAAPSRDDHMHAAPGREPHPDLPARDRRHSLPRVRRRSEAAMKARAALLLSVARLALAGCRGWQSALDPQGPQARELAWLFWLFTAVLAAIWVAVMIALAVALIAPRPGRAPTRSRSTAAGERRTNFVVAGLAVATGVTVLVLTGFSFVSQRNALPASRRRP